MNYLNNSGLNLHAMGQLFIRGFLVLACLTILVAFSGCDLAEKYCEKHPGDPRCERDDGGQLQCVDTGDLCNPDTDVCCDAPDVACRVQDPSTGERRCTLPLEQPDAGQCLPIGSPCFEGDVCCPGGPFDPPPSCNPNQDDPSLPGECIAA